MYRPHQKRITLQLGPRRRAVSVDRPLFELASLRLGVEPDRAEALPAVRRLLQRELLRLRGGDVFEDTSQWARRCLIDSIAEPRLLERRDNWRMRADPDPPEPPPGEA